MGVPEITDRDKVAHAQLLAHAEAVEVEQQEQVAVSWLG